MKYEVFARNQAGDDIIHIGSVQADNDRLAQIYAYSTYDEEDWDYLGVVRTDNLIEVREQSLKSAPTAGGGR